MRLNEVVVGTEVELEVKSGKNDWLFQSIVRYEIKGALLLDPVIYEGKPLNLEAEGITVHIVVKDEDIPIQFRNCVVRNVHLKEQNFLAAACSQEGKRVNRRNAFRIFMGERGVVELIGKNRRLEAVVRDLSMTGFSFVVDVDEWEEDAYLVWLNFLGRYDEKMRMQGEVVRKNEGERGRLIVGCQIIKCANDLSSYISYKQRENLKKFADKRE